MREAVDDDWFTYRGQGGRQVDCLIPARVINDIEDDRVHAGVTVGLVHCPAQRAITAVIACINHFDETIFGHLNRDRGRFAGSAISDYCVREGIGANELAGLACR